MARLYLFAEGRTEQTFADTVLKPHLAGYGVFMHGPVLIAHAHKRHRTHRGGGRNFRSMQNDIVRLLKQDSAKNAFFTSMIDLYALHKGFPGVEEAERYRNDPYRRVEILEESWEKETNDPRSYPISNCMNTRHICFRMYPYCRVTTKVPSPDRTASASASFSTREPRTPKAPSAAWSGRPATSRTISRIRCTRGRSAPTTRSAPNTRRARAWSGDGCTAPPATAARSSPRPPARCATTTSTVRWWCRCRGWRTPPSSGRRGDGSPGGSDWIRWRLGMIGHENPPRGMTAARPAARKTTRRRLP